LAAVKPASLKQLAYPPSKLRSWNEFLEEYESHLAWNTTVELTAATEHVVTAVNSVRFEYFMATAIEHNAFDIKDVNCLINIIFWEMPTELYSGNLLENLYLEDRQEMKDNIMINFRETVLENCRLMATNTYVRSRG
jgi:hypothetical protein